MKNNELYMKRCLQLAKQGEGNVAPNPMVGAVLVFEERIIGEGYHKSYGESHAEVNCIQSVKENNKHLISLSTLFVSFEPCSHFGKTPPCTDLIIREKITKVVIGCRDIFSKVNGKGIEKLKANNIEVLEGILESECRNLNKRFFNFHLKRKPYIILKWAQTLNKKIASDTDNRLFITGNNENRLVHKWRHYEAGILIGTNTALKDDPQLINRFWNGKSPVRLVIDLDLKLPQALKIFDKSTSTIILNYKKQSTGFSSDRNEIFYEQLNKNENLLLQILEACYKLNIQSILVEGGAKTLQSFIDSGSWNEARIITNKNLVIDKGLNAPIIKAVDKMKTIDLSADFELTKIINLSYN